MRWDIAYLPRQSRERCRTSKPQGGSIISLALTSFKIVAVTAALLLLLLLVLLWPLLLLLLSRLSSLAVLFTGEGEGEGGEKTNWLKRSRTLEVFVNSGSFGSLLASTRPLLLLLYAISSLNTRSMFRDVGIVRPAEERLAVAAAAAAAPRAGDCDAIMTFATATVAKRSTNSSSSKTRSCPTTTGFHISGSIPTLTGSSLGLSPPLVPPPLVLLVWKRSCS
mmetsp:Transcript_14677/g.25825  ORF Transcript_14677/g.25825 Transcript_14677/m.25825 type:complete len:222 (-) Transcript_14677:305-970(-)